MTGRAHAAYGIALVAALGTAAAMPVVGHLLAARDAEAQRRMTEIAASMRTPQGFVPAVTCALRGPGSVRCGRVPGSAQDVAEHARRALAAASGTAAALACDRFPRTPSASQPFRVDCLVRFERDGHDVLVTVQSAGPPDAGTPSSAGSDYLVQVS